MPIPSLRVEVQQFSDRADKLLDLADNLSALAPHHSKLVSEIILLRLFSLLEATLIGITCKTLCGAYYLDGTAPQLLSPKARHSNAALASMQTFGRPKPRNLSWTTGSEIKKNVRFLIDSLDPYYSTCDSHAALVDEMRRIRNHIAHNTRSTRLKFSNVIRKYYGANVNSITAGVLLLSPRRSPSLLRVYILSARVIVKEFARG